MRLVEFYEGLGFRETFRHARGRRADPRRGERSTASRSGSRTPTLREPITGCAPSLDGRPVEILLWTDDADRDYERLTAEGAPSLSPPHDWLSNLRLAWVADPDGNPIQLAQRRQ